VGEVRPLAGIVPLTAMLSLLTFLKFSAMPILLTVGGVGLITSCESGFNGSLPIAISITSGTPLPVELKSGGGVCCNVM